MITPLVALGVAASGRTMEAITGWDGFHYPMDKGYQFGTALSEVRKVRGSHKITVYKISQNDHSIELKLDERSTCPDFSTKMRHAWDPPASEQ
jgi:hypothetical protein